MNNRSAACFCGLIGAVLMMGAVDAASAALFSANYDGTLNAQQVPAGGNTAVQLTDANANVGLSTAGTGYGGVGSGLIVPDTTLDIVAYDLDQTFPNTDWFPEKARISLRYYIDAGSPPPALSNLAFWEFVYDAAPVQGFALFGVTTQSGSAELFFRAAPFNAGAVITTGALPTVNPLAPGWHHAVFEYELESPKPPSNSTAGSLATVRATLDGEVGIQQSGVQMGSPSTHSEFRVGTTIAGGNGLSSVSQFGAANIYDDVSIDIPEPAMTGLITVAPLCLMRCPRK